MKIYMLDEVLQFANELNEIETIIHKINELAKRSNVIIQHITVNGEPLEEDFYGYLTEHMAQIEEIRVETIAEREHIDQLIVRSTEYLGRALPELDAFTNRIYQGFSDEVWSTFHSFIEGLEYIIITLESIRSARSPYMSFSSSEVYLQQIHASLQQLMEASTDKDNSLIADLIHYEFKPLLADLHHELGETLDCEVKRDDLQ
ncbi:hypothetical protein B5M42_018735 [Paenibacillus athensensis]|nr:hypothetical protein [Paenibacillus athensensis]MCD1260842.1 hypothetical protein [Paenibacillus athensensis]